jgi:hypothetical protein
MIRRIHSDIAGAIMKRNALPLAAAIVTACALAGCGDADQGPMEKTGEAVDKAAEKTGEAVKNGAEKTGEAVEKAGEKTKDAVK